MAGEDFRHPGRVGAAKTTFCADPETPDGAACHVDACTISGIVVELQETKIQAGLWRTSPAMERLIIRRIRSSRHGNMDEFHRARDEVGDAIHQFGKSAGIGEAQERLVARRAVAQVKSQFDIVWNGRGKTSELFEYGRLIIPLPESNLPTAIPPGKRRTEWTARSGGLR